MKLYSYNCELKFCTAQIIDVFNEIPVKRYDENGLEIDSITVPCVYGNRGRILKTLENKPANLKIPLCSLWMNSFSRDQNRVHSVNDAIQYSLSNYDPIYNIGIPININYSLSIICKFQEDLDQILSNFVVNFNPDIYVAWPHPFKTGNIKSQIIWNGDMTLNYPEDEAQQKPYRIIAETSFTLKTWLFPGTGINNKPLPSISGIIENINTGAYDNNLNQFYPTPTLDSFTEYKQKILNGIIDINKNADLIPQYGDKCWFYLLNPIYDPESQYGFDTDKIYEDSISKVYEDYTTGEMYEALNY